MIVCSTKDVLPICRTSTKYLAQSTGSGSTKKTFPDMSTNESGTSINNTVGPDHTQQHQHGGSGIHVRLKGAHARDFMVRFLQFFGIIQ
jgi:hypothetical protein